MNNNEHWKFFVPGWAPEAIFKDDNVCLLKETVQHNMEKQKEELLKIIDNAINLRLKGKTITEWEETAMCFRTSSEEARKLADRRLAEIERLQNIVVERGAKLNRQGREIADCERLKEENEQLQTENNRWRIEVSEMNQKLDSLQAAYHEKAMELRELQINRDFWILSRASKEANTPSVTFEDVDFIPNDEWEPENDLEKQVKDYFGEQVIGKIGGTHYPGYSKEKSIKLFHAEMSGHNGLLASLKRILNGRRFYLRLIRSYESSVVYHGQPLYKIRIFLD